MANGNEEEVDKQIAVRIDWRVEKVSSFFRAMDRKVIGN